MNHTYHEQSEREAFRELLRKRAVVMFNEQDIKTLLQLPEDVYLLSIGYNEMTMSLFAIIAHEDFDSVPEGVEPPWVQKNLEYVECDQGAQHVKFILPERKENG